MVMKLRAGADGADPFRGDAEPPAVLVVDRRVDELEVADVGGDEDDADDHAGHGPFLVRLLVEDPHEDAGEEGGGRQTEGEGHDLGDEARRIDAEQTGDADRARRRRHAPTMSSSFSDMSGLMIPFIRSWEMAAEMTSSRPAAVESAAARPPAPTRPTTQLGSLAISGLARTMMSWSILTSLVLLAIIPGALGDLHDAVAVLVFPGHQLGLFPVLEPGGGIGVLDVMHRLDEVGAGENRDRRGGGVEQGDADQRVTGGGAGVAHLGHGEEADQDVRQTGGADHQRHGDEPHVDPRPHAGGVVGKAEILLDAVRGRRAGTCPGWPGR